MKNLHILLKANVRNVLDEIEVQLGHLRVRSPKNGTFLERQIFVWHATIVIRSVITIGLEK